MLPDHGLSPRESKRRRHSEHCDERMEAAGVAAKAEGHAQGASAIHAEPGAVRQDAPDAAMPSKRDEAAEASAAAAAPEPSALPMQREATARGVDRRYRDPTLQAERKKAANQEAEEERRRLLSEREAHMQRQETDGELTFRVIENDKVRQHLMWLIDLKNIYAKQLPNMPKEYIVRLVMDPRHRSLLALKRPEPNPEKPEESIEGKPLIVLGGITYRVFDRQALGEIAFCAVSASEQVKGYGTRLMNKLKESVKANEGLSHLITFADNNAVGYFQKQGFSKEILMEREKWSGYIKEYDGGTLMECILTGTQTRPADLPNIVRQQRAAVEGKVLELTRLNVVYPGVPALKEVADERERASLELEQRMIQAAAAARAEEGGAGAALGPSAAPDLGALPPIVTTKEAHARALHAKAAVSEGAVIMPPLPPEEVPGVREAGWMASQPRFRIQAPGVGPAPVKENLYKLMRSLHASVKEHADAWPFLDAVTEAEVPDYYEIIKNPMSLALIGCRLESENYYQTIEQFASDFRIMFINARTYNAPETDYFKCATRLEQFFEAKVAAGLTWSKRF